MRKVIYISAIMFSLSAFLGCSGDEVNENESVVGANIQYKNEFDQYLNSIFVRPYNLDFAYRYEDIESNMTYQLVPAEYKKAVKMANILKYLCMDAYDAVAPKDFMKKYFPKKLFLIGSPGYNPNGTILLGTADAGRKITLYNVNDLDENDVEKLYDYYFRTIYHEFSHILHQTIEIPVDYRKITASTYKGGSWNEAWENSSSLKAGYISDYASNDHHEDFVEMIAHYISYTPEKWNETLERAGEEGKVLLEQKLELVKLYMRNTWSIDLDALRDEINKRAKAISSQNLENITL